MFDLFRSREKSVRILLGGLLVVVALSMLTYLVPSYGSGSGSSDTVVATVGDDTITVPELQRVIQNTVRGRKLPPDIIPNYIPQMVQQMVTDRALAYEATRLGFQVTDQQVADAVRQLIPDLFPDGKFVGKEAYAAMLAQQEMSIGQFESDLRRQVLVARLRDVAVEGTVVTPLEIQAEYEKKYGKMKVQYAVIKPEKYRAEVQPSVQDMQSYYQAHKAVYQTPEKKNLAILMADQAQIEAALHPSDAELENLYNQTKDQYRVPERVQVRHILLMTQGKPAADDPKIKAQAEDVLKQVQHGGDFRALVKKYSEDKGSVDKGGEYWVERNGQMVKEFEDAAFTLKPGESKIVKTTYGYHIVQVMQHQQAHLQTFEEAKAQVTAKWKAARVASIMQDATDRAQGMLQKDPLHPEKVAEALHLLLLRADGVEPHKDVPGIGTNADFDQSIASLKKGEVSQPVALPGNKIALAVVTDVIPPRPSTFAEVQNTIHDTMVQNRLDTAVQNHSRELLDKAKAMGGDLEKAAKSMGLEVKTSEPVTRAGSVEGLGPASYLQEGFARPAGTIFGPVATPDGDAVLKVVEKIAPDLTGLAAERSQIRDQIKSEKARDRNSLFETGVREQLTKEGKIKVHQDVINRMVAQFTATS